MSDDPHARAEEALETAIEMVKGAEGKGVIEGVQAEREAVDKMVDVVGTAAAHGLEDRYIGAYAGTLADICENQTKTAIKDDIEHRRDEVKEAERAGAGVDDFTPLDQFLTDSVESILVVRSTDAKQNALYRWKFEVTDGDGSTFQIETGEPTDTSHLSWERLRMAIFDASGVWTAKPSGDLSGNWPTFIIPLMKQHLETVTTTGPRTVAKDALQNYVRRTTAYGSPEAMVSHNGVYLNGDPESESSDDDPTELWIPNAEVTKVCENQSITPRALQVELEARGYTVPRVSGVSDSTFVNGEKTTYWVLSPDFADPVEYTENPMSSTERAAALLDDDDDERGEVGVIGATDGGEDAANITKEEDR